MAERIRRCLSGAQLLFNGGERLRAVMNFFTAPGTLQQRSGGVTGALGEITLQPQNIPCH